jgi:hypothetical protein
MSPRSRALSRVRDVMRRDAARAEEPAAPARPAPTSPPPAPPAPPAAAGPDLVQLEAEAHHHRDRLALYRARVGTARETSPERLHELERISEAADERLRHARGH